MSEEKITKVCPVMSAGREYADNYCLENRCAWWLGEGDGGCAITAIVTQIFLLRDVIRKVNKERVW